MKIYARQDSRDMWYDGFLCRRGPEEGNTGIFNIYRIKRQSLAEFDKIVGRYEVDPSYFYMHKAGDDLAFLRKAEAEFRAAEAAEERDPAMYWKIEINADGVRQAFFRDNKNIYMLADEPEAQITYCCAR